MALSLPRRQKRAWQRPRPVPAFRSILIPVNTLQPELPADMIDVAAQLATERRASIVLLAFTEVPLGEEMDVEIDGLDQRVAEMAAQARALAARYGVGVHAVAPRTRQPTELILEEARRRRAELIVLGATGRTRASFKSVARDPTTRRLARDATLRTMFVQPSREP
jgi:nucleotide-binding universal stress UspA family protein